MSLSVRLGCDEIPLPHLIKGEQEPERSVKTFLFAGLIFLITTGCFDSTDENDATKIPHTVDSETAAAPNSDTVTESGPRSATAPPSDTEITTDSLCQNSYEFVREIQEHIETAFPCAMGSISRSDEDNQWEAECVVYHDGPTFYLYDGDIDRSAVDALEAAIEADFATFEYPCERGIEFRGEEGLRQNDAAIEAVKSACPNMWCSNYAVTFDDAGAVEQIFGFDDPIRNQPKADAETMACVQQALDGLVFPCFSGMTLKPLFAIL